MKKLLSLILVLCMIFAFSACGQQAAQEPDVQEPVDSEPAVEEPAVDEQEAASELIGGYRFDYVAADFTELTIVVTLKENGFRINPHDEAVGILDGDEWTDNGDGTFTTGPIAMTYEFANADGSCTWEIVGDNAIVPVGYVAPEPPEAPEAPEAASNVDTSFVGSYKFNETNEFGLTVLWILELKEDGSYVLVEENDFVGRSEYVGDSWAGSGNVVKCGPLTGEKPGIDNWATAAEGFTVTINEDGTFVNGGEYVEATGAAGGSYKFNEANDFGLTVLWILELKEDGSYVLAEENDFVGRSEYVGESWTMDGNTVTCGPLVGAKPGIDNWATADEGFTVTIDGENFTAG